MRAQPTSPSAAASRLTPRSCSAISLVRSAQAIRPAFSSTARRARKPSAHAGRDDLAGGGNRSGALGLATSSPISRSRSHRRRGPAECSRDPGRARPGQRRTRTFHWREGERKPPSELRQSRVQLHLRARRSSQHRSELRRTRARWATSCSPGGPSGCSRSHCCCRRCWSESMRWHACAAGASRCGAGWCGRSAPHFRSWQVRCLRSCSARSASSRLLPANWPRTRSPRMDRCSRRRSPPRSCSRLRCWPGRHSHDAWRCLCVPARTERRLRCCSCCSPSPCSRGSSTRLPVCCW